MSSESSAPSVTGRGGTAAARRRLREAEIISATRRLFDERGVRDAQIEDIAKAVGINRAIIYRHFTGKEELFSLTLVQYLDELRVALEELHVRIPDYRIPDGAEIHFSPGIRQADPLPLEFDPA